MRGTMEKVQNTTHGSRCFEHCMPPVQSASATPTSTHFLRFGAVALIVGAVLMLCASMAALYLWKVTEKNVYNVRYSMNINGELREGSMEIDSDNNLESFKTGSGDEEAVEIHDFQSGITGIRFFGGDKCYIKSQIKATLPHMGGNNKELLMSDPTDEIMPVRFDEDFIIWVSAEQPLKDTNFLSNKIIGLCGELPIYWLQPIHPKGHLRRSQLCRIELKGHVWCLVDVDPIPMPLVDPITDGERRKRDTQRAKRQFNMHESEAAAEERDSASDTEDEISRVVEDGDGTQSSEGSAFNPENPYHRGGGAKEEGAMNFDTMLDHQGICCSDCQRSYTHCQRICEPLRGHWPWPYNYRGCQVACRVILPCRWWVARILGIV